MFYTGEIEYSTWSQIYKLHPHYFIIEFLGASNNTCDNFVRNEIEFQQQFTVKLASQSKPKAVTRPLISSSCMQSSPSKDKWEEIYLYFMDQMGLVDSFNRLNDTDRDSWVEILLTNEPIKIEVVILYKCMNETVQGPGEGNFGK